jgi:magnesium-transporting ATPase (P-type)
LVIWAAIHVHKINSGPKTEVTSKYPAIQTIWFWWIIITFSYMFCIFSYDPQSSFNVISRLGGIFGLFTPIGPENFVLFSFLILIVVLVVISKMEKKTRQIEKISARKKILYSLCVLFVLTFFVDLFGMFTSFGSYKYFIQYTILNRSAYMDLRNIQ